MADQMHLHRVPCHLTLWAHATSAPALPDTCPHRHNTLEGTSGSGQGVASTTDLRIHIGPSHFFELCASPKLLKTTTGNVRPPHLPPPTSALPPLT